MPYRFAIIGGGQIGRRHAKLAAEYGILSAVCDSEPGRACLLAGQYGAQHFENAGQMLAMGGFDIVVVCTPNGLHAQHSIAALNAGFHVLCEKPMAITTRDCQLMLDAAENSGKRLFIVKQNRFNPPVRLVRDLLLRGALGRIGGFQLNAFWNRDLNYFRSASWRGTLSLDGGPLFTQFSHFIDLLYWFFGDPARIRFADGRNFTHGKTIEFEDEGIVVLEFPGGIRGTIQYSLNAFARNMEGSLTVFGDKGTVKIGGTYLNTIEHFEVEGESLPDLPGAATANDYGTYQGSMGNHHLVYEAMTRSLEDPGNYFMDPRESMNTVRMIESIYEEMRPGGLLTP